ncbi:restriction system-associated AAA family ATPase [Mariniflexile sp. AS56]|uniref:restriction system-associated AAA family ATPase n=1 Tax=Mariniflexile sp. AS56 TaxID=3063957 RepID=UPI0026F238C4|nr:restriction system-associated AAA family ATPase [Mariniflexile sp. AS56]MDO7173457.1 restriction system-associated AAA family ATPase [Mariniflexile sp. AS56]
MKLLRLKINQEDGFRSLQKDFELFFLDKNDWRQATAFNPYVFAGKNGSGKSNVLEALSEIFYHLDCIYLSNKPSYFNNEEEYSGDDFEDLTNEEKINYDPKVYKVNEYELEYLIFIDNKYFTEIGNKKALSKFAHIHITKKESFRPIVEWVNKTDFDFEEKLSSSQIKSLLPEYVVGYASGENETLSFPFFKSRFIQYDAYYNNLITESIIDPSPESSLIYVDKSYSQFILLANLLMYTNSDSEKDILSPFKEYVGIEGIDSFRLIIKTDILKKFEGKEYPLLNNIDFDAEREGKNTSSYLEKLKKCATTWYEEENYDFYENESNSSSYLILDYKVNEATFKAFQFHFENNPLKLFELFQLLLILEIHSVSQESKNNTYSTENIFLSESINFRPIESKRVLNIKNFEIKKKGLEKNIYTKALSDGEHQFLHSLGLCLLFKDTRSLFLLDEPETHFNPSWKAKFLSSLRFCFEQQEKDSNETMREMLITTHSPYLLSDSDSKYVQVFKKGEKPFHPDFQTFGTSINSIGIKIFNMPNTIGKVAQKRITDYKEELKEIKSPDNLDLFISKVKSEMGESVERLLLLNDAYKKLK